MVNESHRDRCAAGAWFFPLNFILRPLALLALAGGFLLASPAVGQGNDMLVGIWVRDDGWQTVELLFRSDGRYLLSPKSLDSDPDLDLSERGRYQRTGAGLEMMPYEYFGEPSPNRFDLDLSASTLTLTSTGEFPIVYVYQFKPGSREDVLARENVGRELIGTWTRSIIFWGDEELTFRPGGYYFRKDIPESGEVPPEYIRGRYGLSGTQLTIQPYSGIPAPYEFDFFDNTLTLIRSEDFSGDSRTYIKIPGSEAEVRAKAAAADAYLARENWQVGVWDLGAERELTLRPDGRYSSTNRIEILQGIVRGRYSLEAGQIRFSPFIGQDQYSRDNGDLGKVERTRTIDYYDGELQLIDLGALSQSVMLGRKHPGSEEWVLQKTLEAHSVLQQEGWLVGRWEVNDPTGWMEFTFRPDGRYIGQSGSNGVPDRVERGQYVLRPGKITLAPYSGLGVARGFEWDLFDGDLFLIGDSYRMVIARKLPGSETEVIEKTSHPSALQGERGGILGLWTADRPGDSVALVFRPDGHFRLKRCENDVVSHDYGLYSLDLEARTLIYDSRFVPVQTLGLDFYGDTLTLHGGQGRPNTYTVNLGIVDAAIASSLAEDAQEAQVDQGWMARVSFQSPDPNDVHVPVGDIPADPNPGLLFEQPTVFANYQLYRRLIPGFVYFNYLGEIRSVAVTHTREWHFFPTGRVLVRFKNVFAAPVYPNTIVEVSDNWAAYTIAPKSEEQDILHVFADNVVFLGTDLGEEAEMTLEDGRRNLFWGKDYQLLSEWAAEWQPIPCELPNDSEPRLINVPLGLTTTIAPDLGQSQAVAVRLSGPVSGRFDLSGTLDTASTVVLERATQIASPIAWLPLQTNTLPAGPFTLQVHQDSGSVTFFRVRTVDYAD